MVEATREWKEHKDGNFEDISGKTLHKVHVFGGGIDLRLKCDL